MEIHKVMCPAEWVVARKALVEELTRLRDQLYADPRALPGIRSERTLAFDKSLETRSLAGLFGEPEQSAHGWSSLLDRLERYLRVLN